MRRFGEIQAWQNCAEHLHPIDYKYPDGTIHFMYTNIDIPLIDDRPFELDRKPILYMFEGIILDPMKTLRSYGIHGRDMIEIVYNNDIEHHKQLKQLKFSRERDGTAEATRRALGSVWV